MITSAGAFSASLPAYMTRMRVGDLVEDREVVRDHHHALHEAAVAELDQRLGDRLLRRDVERRRDLVGDQQRRVQQRREHHHRPLLHAARELDRVHPEHVLREADESRGGARAPARRSRTRRPSTRAARSISLPTLRVGLRALIAYCGTSETSLKRCLFIARVSSSGSPRGRARPRRSTRRMRAVHPDQALAERRLAAARLACEAHDLAVGDLEADAVERLHVAAERAVVDAEVVDLNAHVRRSFGLKTSSRPTLMM